MAIIKLKILQLFMLEMLSLSHTETKTSALNCLWLASNNNINNVDHSTRLTVLCCAVLCVELNQTHPIYFILFFSAESCMHSLIVTHPSTFSKTSQFTRSAFPMYSYLRVYFVCSLLMLLLCN